MTIAAEEKPGQAPGSSPGAKQMPIAAAAHPVAHHATALVHHVHHSHHAAHPVLARHAIANGRYAATTPGNEKLQVQTQKVGEIVATYASRVKDPTR